MLVKIVREGLGRAIALGDLVTRGSKMKRSEEQQARIAEELQSLSLYQFYACPFCIKVRRAMHRLNLPIETRDVNRHPQFRQELEHNAGKVKVPCLRIDDAQGSQWMLESGDIIAYLEQRYGQAA
ncbi:Glutathione S-transferase, N-terminal domain [Ferrimonas sediminum]|uniref:Glutathione S-transferase, N-terminal domain n=1 Tax=Ferrimonas sediminum TaxID=718193 RepID=A0A1G8Q0E7_9GAMM|nr:glutathione S-transferase N-terminal domain-containing protein [Ferrimonas sediminum]SDI98201.1 Glutathione S-transferase, N-terminal domain [Ferrimonas sediminum]